jgi:hypothetical protein
MNLILGGNEIIWMMGFYSQNSIGTKKDQHYKLVSGNELEVDSMLRQCGPGFGLCQGLDL